jgi:C-terminal processing protease CtpA/Prc
MRWNGGGGGEHKVAACFPGRTKSDAPVRWTKPVAALIGPRVMSSGDSVAHFLKKWFRHPLYGQNTSGASGPKLRYELPSGFATIRFVNKHWQSRRLEGYGVAPDHEVLQDVVELAEGIDSIRAAAERDLEKQCR